MRSSLSSYEDLLSLQKENQKFSYKPPQLNQTDNDLMIKQFHTLKQINRILDSKPESIEAMQQKIRSLIVMFQRQLDINKKLQIQLSQTVQKVQGLQKEAFFRTTQVKNYEKTILQLREKILLLENQSKCYFKKLQQSKEQIKLRDQLVQKMRQSYNNQKYSMQNQLLYLKQKNLDHFKQKINFSTKNILQLENSRPKTQSKPKSGNKTSRNQKSSKKLKKEDIIRRNILALSKKENQLKTGQNLLKKFEQNKILTERIKEIQKGHYDSSNFLRN